MRVEVERTDGRKEIFQVTDQIPAGYQIWCIPRGNLEGYLPVCRVTGGRAKTAEEGSAMLVRMPEKEARVLAAAASRYGARDLEKARKILSRSSAGGRLIGAALALLEKYSQ